MDKTPTLRSLSDAVLSFDNWTQPWMFKTYVLEKTVNINEREVFEKIWMTAVDFDNWKIGSLDEGSRFVINLLQIQYGLDEKVAKQIANAAAYQWR